MTDGREHDAFIEAVASAGLARCTVAVPFLPPWHVPAFLRACTAVCSLERRFPIARHAPVLLRECFSTGVAAVASLEVAAKERSPAELRNGENVFLVRDPEDDDELVDVLRTVADDPEIARRVGHNGQLLAGPDEAEAWIGHYETALRGAATASTASIAAPAAARRRLGLTGPAESIVRFEAWVADRVPLLPVLLGPAFRPALIRFLALDDADRLPLEGTGLVELTYRFAEFAVEHGPAWSPLEDTAELFRYASMAATVRADPATFLSPYGWKPWLRRAAVPLLGAKPASYSPAPRRR